MFAYILLGILLGAGILVMAVKGTVGLMIVGLAIFFFLFVRYGCLSH
ncbi:MAG: hypothetical protein HY301_16610 [Verrucomicrobia bacterium]|nr:hypothetical protein [Verrucomicrobiota bacterium]